MQSQQDNGCLVTIIGGVILLGIASSVGQCSQSETGNVLTDAYNAANADMGNAIAAQETPAPMPLSAASADRGVSHLRLAVGAEGFAGAMIYSQNCYDALSHSFTWAKLDQCGAFDLLAARSIDGAETADLINEPSYFDSEAAATRYLTAATGAGEDPSEADQRLEELQSRAGRARLVGQRRSVVDEAGAGSHDDLGDAILNELVEEAAAEEQKREGEVRLTSEDRDAAGLLTSRLQ